MADAPTLGPTSMASPQYHRANRQHTMRVVLATALVAAVGLTGCVAPLKKWVALRSTPRNPLTETLGLLTRSGPKPTDRTIQLLRRYDLEDELDGSRPQLLARLTEIDMQEPNRLHAYALAELAYVGAKREEQADRPDKA